jgi:hypothetical protein
MVWKVGQGRRAVTSLKAAKDNEKAELEKG